MFDDFEYTTASPHVLGSTVYQTTPQTYDPFSGNRHIYLNFVNDLPAGTVCYDRTINICDVGGKYDFWTKSISLFSADVGKDWRTYH